jgi:hypothetical protein
MAKRPRRVTESTIDKRLKEGRGSGKSASYMPWLTDRDVLLRGLSLRRKSWKTGRVHHVLSKLERQYFYMLEWSLEYS